VHVGFVVAERILYLPSIGTGSHTSYTMHQAPGIIHHAPYTPYTIHHAPYTMHHTPYTMHHTPCTIRIGTGFRFHVLRIIATHRSYPSSMSLLQATASFLHGPSARLQSTRA
jgi:hypothetical protein